MVYQTYTTHAFVCGSWLQNTSDKTFLLYTECLGMIYANARSVREERSKQRYALQDFSYIYVSLIQGNSGWRIGSVTEICNVFSDASDRKVRASMVWLCKLLRRFVSGTEPSSELFSMVVTSLKYLSKNDLKNRSLVQNMIEYKILYFLGYVSPTLTETSILEMSINELDCVVFKKDIDSIKIAITKAREISHL